MSLKINFESGCDPDKRKKRVLADFGEGVTRTLSSVLLGDKITEVAAQKLFLKSL